MKTELVKKQSIKIIFATISMMHLQKWNETRKQQRKTKKLQLGPKYEEMQNTMKM